MGRSFLEGRSYVRGRAPNLNRLSRTRKMEKTSLLIQFSVRVIFSRVYVQLDARPIKKVIGRSYIREKTLNLNRLSSVREKVKPHPQHNSIIRAISSYMCVQLDVRSVEEGYREVVYSWKSSELESVESCEERKISPSA